MNLKLVLQLSLFGLIMAFATVSLIPEKLEFIFWIIIFAFVGYVLAKVGTGKYFWHGFMVSIFNSIWLVAVHLMFFDSYIAHHPDMSKMNEGVSYFATHPRMFMLITAVPFGIFFGLFQGVFAWIASKLVKPRVV